MQTGIILQVTKDNQQTDAFRQKKGKSQHVCYRLAISAATPALVKIEVRPDTGVSYTYTTHAKSDIYLPTDRKLSIRANIGEVQSNLVTVDPLQEELDEPCCKVFACLCPCLIRLNK